MIYIQIRISLSVLAFSVSHRIFKIPPRVQEKPHIDWKRRLITAAVAIPTLIASIALPEPAFSFMVVAAICIAYRELSQLISYHMYLNYFLFAILYYFSMDPIVVYLVTILNLIVPLVISGPNIGIKAGLFHLFFLYLFVIPTLFGSLIRNLETNGQTLAIIWLLTSFASDAGALVVGNAFGRHLCCPSISPKKTWEGIVGALIGGIGSGIFFHMIGMDRSKSLLLEDFVVLGAIASVFGMIGDLIESGFKRFVATKDSSGWLPGHGGYLDRLDALGACAPLIYFYCKARGW